MVQLAYYDMAKHTPTQSLTHSLFHSPSVSLVCLPQSSGQCTAQLFSRWSVMIRELLEAVTLLKCSTAVSFWSIMLKCPQRALEQRTVSWNKLLLIQPLNLSLSISKKTVSSLLFFLINCSADRESIRLLSEWSHLHKKGSLIYFSISSFHLIPEDWIKGVVPCWCTGFCQVFNLAAVVEGLISYPPGPVALAYSFSLLATTSAAPFPLQTSHVSQLSLPCTCLSG